VRKKRGGLADIYAFSPACQLLKVIQQRLFMNKLKRLPRPIELSAGYIDGLNLIADDLEQRADALRGHARQIRHHAANLESAAAVLRKNRSSRSKTVQTIALSRQRP
jgi:hypothetical protein